jgi:hypothetical protein
MVSLLNTLKMLKENYPEIKLKKALLKGSFLDTSNTET